MKQTKIKHPASDIPENSLRALFAGAAIFACASFVALAASGAHAQSQSLGAKYGTREPAKCASMTKPAKGAPSNAQALEYLKCTLERESGSNLFLLQDLMVQVAPKGRRDNPRAPISNIDTDYPVYAYAAALCATNAIRCTWVAAV